MMNHDVYDQQYCGIHRVYILFFKANKIMDETQCWQCIRDANHRKWKEEQALRDQQDFDITQDLT